MGGNPVHDTAQKCSSEDASVEDVGLSMEQPVMEYWMPTM